MKTQPRRKSNEPTVPEPSWRRPPPRKRRPKVRQQAALITHLPSARDLPRWRWPAIHLPRLPWRLWVLVPVLALVVFGVVQVFTNDAFFVFAADIRGNQRVLSEEIYAASDVDGKNILWVLPRQVARNVMTVPGVQSVQVHVWPPNRVVIDVQEQTPLAIWKIGDQATWIAEDGRPMPAVGAPPPISLTDGSGAAALTAGEQTQAGSSDAGGTGQAGAAGPQMRPGVLAALKTLHERRPDLTNIFYGREEGLYFVAAPGGWTVYLGDDGDIAGRLALLAAAQPALSGEKVKPRVVDLRVDKRVIYR